LIDPNCVNNAPPSLFSILEFVFFHFVSILLFNNKRRQHCFFFSWSPLYSFIVFSPLLVCLPGYTHPFRFLRGAPFFPDRDWTVPPTCALYPFDTPPPQKTFYVQKKFLFPPLLQSLLTCVFLEIFVYSSPPQIFFFVSLPNPLPPPPKPPVSDFSAKISLPGLYRAVPFIPPAGLRPPQFSCFPTKRIPPLRHPVFSVDIPFFSKGPPPLKDLRSPPLAQDPNVYIC